MTIWNALAAGGALLMVLIAVDVLFGKWAPTGYAILMTCLCCVGFGLCLWGAVS